MTATDHDTPDTSIDADESTAKDDARAERQSASNTSKTSSASTRRKVRTLPAILIALTLAFVAAGVVFLVRAAGADDSGSANNKAIIDKKTTSEVVTQVSTGLTAVLSYDYRRPQVAQAAVKKYLTGDAPAQYAKLLTQLTGLAKTQQLTFVAKVSTAGVISLHDDTAQLLVFVDQKSTRGTDGKSSVSAAQVRITAVRDGDLWRISELVPI